MWQILDSQSLASLPIRGNTWSELSNKRDKPLPMQLFGECFQLIPSKRPSAALVAQNLLDEYNDRCARSALEEPDVETIATVKRRSWDLLKVCRNQYWDNKNDYKQVTPQRIGEQETLALLQSLESWNEPAELTLAPEIHFLLGAGIFWGFVDPKTVDTQGPRDNCISPLGMDVF